MSNIPMLPVIHLKIGDRIVAKHPIVQARTANWKFADELPSRFSMLPQGAVLEIFELNNTAWPPWVKAWLPNTHNTAYLKIAGEELAGNFLLSRGIP